MSKNIKVLGKGVDKHQLVEIDVLDVSPKIRKMYGIAKDKKQENFFKLLGFKFENKTPMGNFYSKFFDKSDNNDFKKPCPECNSKDIYIFTYNKKISNECRACGHKWQGFSKS